MRAFYISCMKPCKAICWCLHRPPRQLLSQLCCTTNTRNGYAWCQVPSRPLFPSREASRYTPTEEARRQQIARESAVELSHMGDYLRDSLSRSKRPSPLSVHEAKHPFNTFTNIALLRPACAVEEEQPAHPTLITIFGGQAASKCTRVRRRRKRRRVESAVQLSETRPGA